MTLKSVKLVSFVVLCIVATIAMFMDMTNFAGWSGFITWIFPFYVSANVVEKIFVNGKKK